MPVWQRVLVTIAAMLLASFVVNVVWEWVFGANMPVYLAGVVGGIAALPVWELSKQYQVKDQS